MFLIMLEDEFGDVKRAFTWRGNASEGISRAKLEALIRGQEYVDIWAVPVANKNLREQENA
jgi:hypothetical protein